MINLWLTHREEHLLLPGVTPEHLIKEESMVPIVMVGITEGDLMRVIMWWMLQQARVHSIGTITRGAEADIHLDIVGGE